MHRLPPRERPRQAGPTHLLRAARSAGRALEHQRRAGGADMPRTGARRASAVPRPWRDIPSQEQGRHARQGEEGRGGGHRGIRDLPRRRGGRPEARLPGLLGHAGKGIHPVLRRGRRNARPRRDLGGGPRLRAPIRDGARHGAGPDARGGRQGRPPRRHVRRRPRALRLPAHAQGRSAAHVEGREVPSRQGRRGGDGAGRKRRGACPGRAERRAGHGDRGEGRLAAGGRRGGRGSAGDARRATGDRRGGAGDLPPLDLVRLGRRRLVLVERRRSEGPQRVLHGRRRRRPLEINRRRQELGLRERWPPELRRLFDRGGAVRRPLRLCAHAGRRGRERRRRQELDSMRGHAQRGAEGLRASRRQRQGGGGRSA